MEKKQSSVTNRVGRALEGASVAVYNDAAVLATIYADNETTTLANPLTTDSLGAFAYKAADGVYSWVISHASITTKTLTEIQHEDPLDSPSPTVAGLAAPGGAATVGVTPTATLAAANVQAALAELDAEKVAVATLAADAGSSLSGHIASGTGAVATTVGAKLRELSVTPHDFFIAAETDATAMVQRAIDAIRATTYGGKLTLTTFYRLTGPLDLYPSVPLTIEGNGNASGFIIDYDDIDGVALKFTHPTTPSTRGQRAIVRDFKVSCGAGVTLGPVAIEHRYASDLKMTRVEITHYKRNTALRLSALYNCDFQDVVIWGAGEQKVYKSTPDGCTFSITSGTTTLTSSAATFAVGDVGKGICVAHANGAQVYTITSYTSTTEVQTNETALATSTAATGAFEGVRGSLALAGTTLTLNADVLTADDIGRFIYVLDAESVTFPSTGTRPLRAGIVSVTAANQCELSVAATAAVTDVYILFSPGIEIFGESGQNNNDAVFYGLHSEEYRGAGLVVTNAVNLYMEQTKLHAQNGATNTATSLIGGVFGGAGGFVSGDFEGITANTLGRHYLSGQTGGLHFDDWSGIAVDGQKLIAMANCATSAVTSVGDITINNLANTATFTAPFSITGSGKLRATGTIASYGTVPAQPSRVFDSPVQVASGSADAPGITPINDTDTGVAFPAANTVAVSTGGVESLRVDSSRRLLKGHTAALTTSSGVTPAIQNVGTSNDSASAMLYNFANDTTANTITLAKSRGAVGVQTIVASSDTIGNIIFEASDGTQLRRAATISAVVDGTPGASDMPGRIAFSVTPDGAAAVVEALRITNAGALVHRNNTTTVVDANSHVGLRSYTVATLPSAATAARLIYVSDGAANKRLAFSDGTNWRFPDGAIVS